MPAAQSLALLVLLALLIAYGLTDTYTGNHYACPYCGARRADRHARECPWHE